MKNFSLYLIISAALMLASCSGTDYKYKLDLSGDWTCCRINSPDDYPARLTECKWQKVVLPDSDLFKTLGSITDGYLVFRKNFSPYLIPDGSHLLQAGEIMNADRIYMNGRLIGESGKFPPAFKSAWAKFRSYPLKKDDLRQGDNTIDILLYYNAELWISKPLQIVDAENGTITAMKRNYWQIHFMQAVAMVLLCFAGFFFLFFIKRRSEIVYFYFSLCCFFLADMVTLQYFENLYAELPISSNTIMMLNQSGLVLFPPMLAFFFRSYLGQTVSFKRITVYLIFPIITVIGMIFAQDRSGIIFWRNLFLPMIALYILDIMILSFRRLITGNREGMLMFIGILPILLFGIHDVMMFTFLFFSESIPLYVFGIPLMIGVIAIHLVNRFINSLNMTEQLNIMLEEKMEEGKRLAMIDQEISIARKIQLSAVPGSLPDQPGFTIHVKYVPAANIGGDFYNFHTLHREGIGIMIADVSGHGVPASLIASMVKILFSVLAPIATDPAMFLKGMNSYLFGRMDDNFLTAGYCFLNREKMTGFYSRAGHEPLLHISSAGGKVELKKYMPSGRAVGIINEVDPGLEKFRFSTGDRFILYTDCIIEEINSANEMFGEERFISEVMSGYKMPSHQFTEHIFSLLEKWTSDKNSLTFEDDFTLIVIDIV